jgi:hypothetical protein
MNYSLILTPASHSAKNFLTFLIGNIPKILGMFPILEVKSQMN